MRVGVLGCGRFGRKHARVLDELGVLAAVADPDAAARAPLEALLPHVRVFADPDAVLGDPSLDAVVVATPWDEHVEPCRVALERGHHVLCEKPFALRRAAAEKLQALALARRRVLRVGHVLVHDPAVARLREAIARGDLGDVVELESFRAKAGPCGPGGLRWELAPHDLAVAFALVGALEGSGHVSPTEVSFDLRGAGGARARVVVAASAVAAPFRLRVRGRRASAEIVGGRVRVDARELAVDVGEPLKRQWAAFAAAIAAGEGPDPSLVPITAILEQARAHDDERTTIDA